MTDDEDNDDIDADHDDGDDDDIISMFNINGYTWCRMSL